VAAVVSVLLLGGSSAGPAPQSDAPAPSATVVVHGRPGTFGALGEVGPSGQSLAGRPVPGWGLPPGRQVSRTAISADGTVLMATVDYTASSAYAGSPTSDEVVIGAYDPRTNAYGNVRVLTTTGRIRPVDREGRPAAPPVADLEPVAGGTAVAFTAWPGQPPQRPAGDGEWPVFGLLSKVDGRWQVARGAGWANQWSAAELRTLSPELGAQACPEQPGAGQVECRGLNEMASLPRSHDIIVAQYLGGPGRRNGALVALRVTGPDGAGRFAVKVMGHYLYPHVKDPGTADPGDLLDVAPWTVQADPTGIPGDERFVASLNIRNRDQAGSPGLLQEFSYDARTGTIRPVSAPFIAGDRVRSSSTFYSYTAALYDRQGNLWAARSSGFHGGSLAVYAAAGGRRKLGAAPCPYQPARPMDSYVTTGARQTVWGQPCRPDYDILQAEALPATLGLVADPTSHDVVSLAFGGVLLPIRPAGAGSEMTFQVGNVVDVGRKLLPTTEGSLADHRLGAIDGAHRLWFSAMQARPGAVGVPLDQWLYSVDLGDLFTPRPVAVSDTPGRSVTVQAEHTTTMSTVAHRPGRWATVDVDSDAYFRSCDDWPTSVACGYDGIPGNGFILADHTGFGHLRGAVDYRVQVSSAGTFRLAYRVVTFAVTKDARIELTADGRTYTTAVSTGGQWRTIWVRETVALPAGVQTIRLSVPPGGGGWALNWLSLQRT
jgi:hypothetical protein